MDMFQFLCDTEGSNLTNEEIIKMLPPWKTKILDVKRTSDDHEKIQLTFVIAATTVDAVKRWVQAYQELTFCTYYIRNTPQCGGEKVLFSQVLICHHNCKKKIKEDEFKKKLHKRRRDTNCPSYIRIKLYVPKKRTRKDTPLKLQDEDMPCEIVLIPTHNHEINNAEALSWRRVSDVVKQRINNLFDRGHNPGSARELLKLDIYINYDNYETLLADRKFYPDYQYCSYLYKKYKKDNDKIDAINDTQDISELTKIINDYREVTNEDTIRFIIDESGYVITICTPLFQRVHEYAKYCSDVVVLDSIKCDTKTDNVKLYMLYTTSECGNLPLGAIITSSESTEKLIQGFKILKEILQNRIFHGNVSGPKVFLSNDLIIDKEAIKSFWTESLNLLSPYHVLQNFFKWLIKPNNSIIKNEQLMFFQNFKSIVFAASEEECEEQYHKLLFIADKYTMLVNYLISLWDRRRLWAFTYRSTLLNKISKNILKEQVFDRIKDLNISQMLNFILVKLQTYYEGKILNYLISESFINFKHLSKPPQSVADRIQKLGENLFLVPSETQDDLFYLVNLDTLSCSCSDDNTSQICQHVDWLRSLQPVDIEKEREETKNLKKTMYFIATGKNFPDGWSEIKNKSNHVQPRRNKSQKKKIKRAVPKSRAIKKRERKVKEKKLLPNLGDGISWVFVKQPDGTLKSVPVIRHIPIEISNETNKKNHVIDISDSDEYEVDVLEDIYAIEDTFDNTDKQTDLVDSDKILNEKNLQENVMGMMGLQKNVTGTTEVETDVIETEQKDVEMIDLQTDVMDMVEKDLVIDLHQEVVEVDDAEKDIIMVDDFQKNIVKIDDLEKNVEKIVDTQENVMEAVGLQKNITETIDIEKNIIEIIKPETSEDIPIIPIDYSENYGKIESEETSESFNKNDILEVSKNSEEMVTPQDDKNCNNFISVDDSKNCNTSIKRKMPENHNKITTDDIDKSKLQGLLRTVTNHVERLGLELINDDRNRAMNALTKCEEILKKMNNFDDFQSVLETHDVTTKRKASMEPQIENKKNKHS